MLFFFGGGVKVVLVINAVNELRAHYIYIHLGLEMTGMSKSINELFKY